MNKKIKEYLKKKGLRKNQKIDGYFMGVDFIKVKTSYKNCSNLVTIRMSSGNIVDVRNLGSGV
jgi:predicted DNA binding CopG/RHH family protein